MAEVNYDIYSKMQVGTPFRSYKKTILAKLLVRVLNSFSGEPEELVLFGNNSKDSATVDTWNEREDAYFRKSNRRALESGLLISFVREGKLEDVVPEFMADASDEELKELFSKHFKLTNALTKMTSPVVVQRLLDLARSEDKPESVTSLIIAKLSELQGQSVVEE